MGEVDVGKDGREEGFRLLEMEGLGPGQVWKQAAGVVAGCGQGLMGTGGGKVEKGTLIWMD